MAFRTMNLIGSHVKWTCFSFL